MYSLSTHALMAAQRNSNIPSFTNDRKSPFGMVVRGADLASIAWVHAACLNAMHHRLPAPTQPFLTPAERQGNFTRRFACAALSGLLPPPIMNALVCLVRLCQFLDRGAPLERACVRACVCTSRQTSHAAVADVYSQSALAQLHRIIKDHHVAVCAAFPDASLTLNFHKLLHAARYIRLHGGYHDVSVRCRVHALAISSCIAQVRAL